MAPGRRRWPGFTAVLGAAGVAYLGASFHSNNLTYAPLRSSEWVRERMAGTPYINALQKDDNYLPVPEPRSLIPLAASKDVGAISNTILSFRDRRDPQHTITFVHCGPLTCGFPFLVHGGVLGTLIYQSVHLARQIPDEQHMGGNLNIKYRRPTLVDQILCIETQVESGGVQSRINSSRSGHTLVEGLYKDR